MSGLAPTFIFMNGRFGQARLFLWPAIELAMTGNGSCGEGRPGLRKYYGRWAEQGGRDARELALADDARFASCRALAAVDFAPLPEMGPRLEGAMPLITLYPVGLMGRTIILYTPGCEARDGLDQSA